VAARRNADPLHRPWGIDEDLTQAMKIAVHEAIDFLGAEKHLSREDAYMLSSVAVDFDVTQVVTEPKASTA